MGCKVIVLHVADLGLIPSITYVPMSVSGVIAECSAVRTS